MKKLILLIAIFQLQTAFCQELKPGIYEIQEKIDTAFMRSISKIHTENWSCVKKEVNQQFCHLIDEKVDAKYVILAKIKNEYGVLVNKMIFLEKQKPMQNTPNEDGKVRNYGQLCFSIDPKFDKTWVYESNNNDFNGVSSDFTSEYALQQENKRGKKNVGVAYD